jgi:hypothetical protein
MSRHDCRPPTMTIATEPITVWQALSLLGAARDGSVMSEERARRALRDIGMKESEMNEPYPEEGVHELLHLLEHPDCLDKTVEEASKWHINRN